MTFNEVKLQFAGVEIAVCYRKLIRFRKKPIGLKLPQGKKEYDYFVKYNIIYIKNISRHQI